LTSISFSALSSELTSLTGLNVSTVSLWGYSDAFPFFWALAIAACALSFLRLLMPRAAFSLPSFLADEVDRAFSLFSWAPEWRCFFTGDSFSMLTFSWCRFLWPDFPVVYVREDDCGSFVSARFSGLASLKPTLLSDAPAAVLIWLFTWMFLKGLRLL
jgi:hypothetical protein